MSDYFKAIKQREKEERDDLAEQGLKELLKTDWMKVRLNREKTLEESVRWAIDAFIFAITEHEKEMAVCPKLEELLLRISREQLEGNLPRDYADFVGQTDRDDYLHSCTSIEDVRVEFGSFMEDAVALFDYEELEATLLKDVPKN